MEDTNTPEGALPPDSEKLSELKPGDTISFKCIAIKAGQPTINGNVYSEAVLKKAAFELNARAKDRTVMGQLGNPPDGKSRMVEVSHLLKPNFEVKDGMVVGSVEVLDTVRGRDLVEMMQGGMKFTFAPRGMGSFSPEGVVGEDFQFVSMDLVPESDLEPQK